MLSWKLLLHVGIFLILGGLFFAVFAYYYCEVYPLDRVYRADDEGVIVIRPQSDIPERPENYSIYRMIVVDSVSRTVYPLRSYRVVISLSLFVAGVVILTYALWTSGFRAKINIASAEK